MFRLGPGRLVETSALQTTLFAFLYLPVGTKERSQSNDIGSRCVQCRERSGLSDWLEVGPRPDGAVDDHHQVPEAHHQSDVREHLGDDGALAVERSRVLALLAGFKSSLNFKCKRPI